MDQSEIISRCQQGDLYCFEELYRLHSRQALGLAYNMSGSSGIAEDIVQEAFLICYREIGRVKNPETFNVWFYRILVRVAWRMVAKHRKTFRLIDGSLDSAENDILDSYTAVQMEFSVDRIFIRDAVKKLKLSLKTPVILYYFNEMSVKDIAKVLGCYQGTVKSRLHKARELLMKELQPHYRSDLQISDLRERRRANGR